MTLMLCLAHYCDTHGPTPLMVTEGLPVPCSVCYEHDPKDLQRPQTRVDAVTSTTAVIADALKNIDLSTAAPQDVRSQRATPSKIPGLPRASAALSTLESPPASPHRPAGDAPSLPIPPLRRDSGFRRTYDDYATKRLQSPCQSCALTLPDQHGAQSSKTAATYPTHTSSPSTTPTDGSTAQSSSACSKSTSATDPRGPTLRTRAPYARVFGPGTLIAEDVATPPKSRDSSSDREGGNIKSRHRTSGAMASRSSTTSSVSSRSVSSHTHFLDYTSTHHPLQPDSFSSLRASCLRALSQETLPRSTSVSDTNPKNPTSPTLPNVPASPFPTSNTQSGFVTTHTSGTAGAGGPMAFGDPVAGFTTAYVFRVHDKYARGNRRLYAFLLLSDHRECQAMSIFGFLSAAFRDMATWIQALAEETEKREKEADLPPWMQNMNPKVPSLSQGPTNPTTGQPMIPAEMLGLSGGSPATAPAAKGVSSTYTPLSGGTSFTNGGSRRYVGSVSNTLNHRPRGLPELVGMPDFFIHLHAKFVRLLLELGVQLSA